MKSTLLLIAFIFCSVGSTPQKAAEELMARYVKSYNEKNKTLMAEVTVDPYTYDECNTTKKYSHDEIFKMAEAVKFEVPSHQVCDAKQNDEKTMMWFKIDWNTTLMLNFEVEAVLENGTWKMKSQKLECPKRKFQCN